jgi:hypothetical protein
LRIDEDVRALEATVPTTATAWNFREWWRIEEK